MESVTRGESLFRKVLITSHQESNTGLGIILREYRDGVLLQCAAGVGALSGEDSRTLKSLSRLLKRGAADLWFLFKSKSTFIWVNTLTEKLTTDASPDFCHWGGPRGVRLLQGWHEEFGNMSIRPIVA